MTLYKWSTTAASNSTADSTINWAEGQAPSTVNDSARAMMAATSKWRDDISGAKTTAGTSTAYTLTSGQVFASLSAMSGMMVAFVPHATNGATVTLNVDGLGAKALRSAPSVELEAGVLILGTPYVATYYNATTEWILHGAGGWPTYVPLGGIMDYTGSTAPNSRFVLPYGQAISRTTYANYFSLVSTAYGTGDGSTTFNVPDLRGRVSVGKDDMGGSAASRVTTAGGGVDGATLGAVGGGQSVTILQANLPDVDFVVDIPSGQGSHTHSYYGGENNISITTGVNRKIENLASTTGAATLPAMTGTAASGGSDTALQTLPPAIVLNKILRVL